MIKLNIFLFLIKDDELLEKYNEIWGKVKNNLKKSLTLNLISIFPCNIVVDIYNFLDSTKLKIVWIKITTFFKQCVSIILRSFSS